MADVLWVLLLLAGVGLIVWGAETFAEHLATASVHLGVSSFALALLLAGAEPEEVATAVTASARDLPAIAFGDVIEANVAVCLLAVGVGAAVAPLPFGPRVRRYAVTGLPLGALAAWSSRDGRVSRIEGLVLVTGDGPSWPPSGSSNATPPPWARSPSSTRPAPSDQVGSAGSWS